MADNEGTEVDVHIWAKPETERMAALYTISVGKRALCVDMPRDEALRSLGEYLDEMLSEDVVPAPKPKRPWRAVITTESGTRVFRARTEISAYRKAAKLFVREFAVQDWGEEKGNHIVALVDAGLYTKACQEYFEDHRHDSISIEAD